MFILLLLKIFRNVKLMNESIPHNSTEDLDIKDLVIFLWNAKILIIFCTTISIVAASYYLNGVTRKYSIEYILKPVVAAQNVNYGDFGGLAALTGIKLPTSTNSDFKIFEKLLTSVEVSRKIFSDDILMQKIFAGEWDVVNQNYRKPQISELNLKINKFKRYLTGSKYTYHQPSPDRLAIEIPKIIKISINKKTGFLIISSEVSNPKDIVKLIIAMTKAADDILRDRYIQFSLEPLSFYKKKISTARSREHREALAQLIGSEEQKLMLASSGKYFVAEPVIDPRISLTPTSPNSKSTLLLSSILGVLSGLILAAGFNSFRKAKV